MQRDKEPAETPAPRVERRHDDLTRTVVDGLEKMLADFEKFPRGPEKTAAITAVTRFAKEIAEVLERRKQGGGGRAADKPAPSPGAKPAS